MNSQAYKCRHTHSERDGFFCLYWKKFIQTNPYYNSKVIRGQMFRIQSQGYFYCTSSSRKSTAASSSTFSFKGVLKNWISNWICWNPLLLKVWSRTNSCKLLRNSFTIVDTTDSCSLQATSVHFVHIPPQKTFPSTLLEFITCVYSTFVKISTFCLNNFARWVSKSWLLALWVLDWVNLSSRNGLLLDEAVLPLLSLRRCLRSPWGKICFTSRPTASS